MSASARVIECSADAFPAVVVPQLATAVDDSVSTKYTALTTSIEICEFLDTHRTSESRGDAPARSLAPASLAAKAASDELIALVHQDSADPNFLLLTARTEAELRANSAGLPGQFVRGRKKALEGYLAAAETQTEVSGRMENFLKDKLKAMDGLAYVLDNPTSAPAQEFLAKGQQHYLSVGETLLKLNAKLPREDRSGFVTLADLHVGGWFARILACAGAKDLKDVDGAFEALYKTFERKEDELVILKLWWSSMVTRKRCVPGFVAGGNGEEAESDPISARPAASRSSTATVCTEARGVLRDATWWSEAGSFQQPGSEAVVVHALSCSHVRISVVRRILGSECQHPASRP